MSDAASFEQWEESIRTAETESDTIKSEDRGLSLAEHGIVIAIGLLLALMLSFLRGAGARLARRQFEREQEQSRAQGRGDGGSGTAEEGKSEQGAANAASSVDAGSGRRSKRRKAD